jgi:hypothetical protein
MNEGSHGQVAYMFAQSCVLTMSVSTQLCTGPTGVRQTGEPALLVFGGGDPFLEGCECLTCEMKYTYTTITIHAN